MNYLKFLEPSSPSIFPAFAMRASDANNEPECGGCDEDGCPHCEHVIDDYGNDVEVPEHSLGWTIRAARCRDRNFTFGGPLGPFSFFLILYRMVTFG